MKTRHFRYIIKESLAKTMFRYGSVIKQRFKTLLYSVREHNNHLNFQSFINDVGFFLVSNIKITLQFRYNSLSDIVLVTVLIQSFSQK